MGGIIVYGFLLAGLICGGGILLIMWLNSKDSSIDNRTYDKSFDPGRMVSKYRVNEVTDEDTFDPERELGRYAEHRFSKKRKGDEEDYSLDEPVAEDPASSGGKAQPSSEEQTTPENETASGDSGARKKTDEPAG